MLLDNAEFLARLKELFASTRQGGTVFLTQKRYTYDDGTGTGDVAMSSSSSDPSSSSSTYPCLIRATDGKKLKLSTLVHPADLVTFHAAYSTVLKASFTSLRPKRPKGKKAAAGAGAGTGAGAVGGAAKKKKAKGAAAGAAGETRATTGKAGLSLALPKVVGPRRGSGVEKRRRAVKRKVKALQKIRQREKARSGKASGIP